MKYLINLAAAADRHEIQQLIVDTLPLPDWYGKNLDALYDVLTELEEETEIVFATTSLENQEELSEQETQKRRYIRRMQKMCQDAMRENEKIKVSFILTGDCC